MPQSKHWVALRRMLSAKRAVSWSLDASHNSYMEILALLDPASWNREVARLALEAYRTSGDASDVGQVGQVVKVGQVGQVHDVNGSFEVSILKDEEDARVRRRVSHFVHVARSQGLDALPLSLALSSEGRRLGSVTLSRLGVSLLTSHIQRLTSDVIQVGAPRGFLASEVWAVLDASYEESGLSIDTPFSRRSHRGSVFLLSVLLEDRRSKPRDGLPFPESGTPVDGDAVTVAGECSICLDAIPSGDELCTVYTLCRHTFHSRCLRRWTKRRRSCPLCRSPLPAIHHRSGYFDHALDSCGEVSDVLAAIRVRAERVLAVLSRDGDSEMSPPAP